MIFNLPEVKPVSNNRYFYTLEKSLYGGYLIYVELESDLKAAGTVDDETTRHHWKPLPHHSFNPDQLKLKFED